MGVTPEHAEKRPRRFVDKKFNFDWDASDDTSALAAPIVPLRVKSNSLSDARFDDRHWSEKSLTEMNDRDWRIFKEDYAINTSGGVLPPPIRHWHESPLPKELLTAIQRLGYAQPTPIQRQAIPVALQGRDFIGIAETGSGKTASFILPMCVELLQLPKMTPEVAADGPYGLILVPTRELANQIESEARKFLQPLGFKCFAIVGGHAITEQAFNLRNGAEIIIATPGRLRDCLDEHIIVLNQCKSVVLDEADRMIDMNFEEDIRYILDTVPRCVSNMSHSQETTRDGNRILSNSTTTRDASRKYPMHMTMFSATMPPAVERLAKQYLQKPATISVGTTGRVSENIQQRIEYLRGGEGEKAQRLNEILLEDQEIFGPPVIIFVNRKQTVDYLTRRLESFGLKAVGLHGGKSQDQRESALAMLKSGQKDYLIATDVAGRGIDVKNVSLVINYDMAKNVEGNDNEGIREYFSNLFLVDYTHRVGRTGRAGAKGVAITLLTDEDSEIFNDLRLLVQKSPSSQLSPSFLQACRNINTSSK